MRFACAPTLFLLWLMLCGIAPSEVESVHGNQAGYLLIPMDEAQNNHLKAYGIVFNHVRGGNSAQWLLNYRGGSFLAENVGDIERATLIRDVSAEAISYDEALELLRRVDEEGRNSSAILLEETPDIAVYTPPDARPWDDAVTLVLDYAEVPFERLYDAEVLAGDLAQYDWLHLHHEDFTGQFGKFWASYRDAPWYLDQVRELESLAGELGFEKVSQLKLAVAREIRSFVGNGGFLFAMCSGTNTLDIALAADGLDIVPEELDGDPVSPNVNDRLDFGATLAFEGFRVNTDPYIYRHDDIDVEIDLDRIPQQLDYFTLFSFSARWDPVPTMLTQNHAGSIRGFYGQTTAFRKDKVKPNVVILGETPGRNQVKYLFGHFGEGTFTFYGGHDPEDYTHRVNDPPTDLNLHPNSPGYRLILNNILFPAAEEQKLET